MWSALRHIHLLGMNNMLRERRGQSYLERNEEVHGLPNPPLDGLAQVSGQLEPWPLCGYRVSGSARANHSPRPEECHSSTVSRQGVGSCS